MHSPYLPLELRMLFTSLYTVYDVSSKQSFEGLEVWLNELDQYATKKDLIKMLVANKIDKVSYWFADGGI